MFNKSVTFFLVVFTASVLMLNCSNSGGGGGSKEETPPEGGGSAGDVTLPSSDSGSNAIQAKAAAAVAIDQGFNTGSILLLAQLTPEMEEPDGGAGPKDAGGGDDNGDGGDDGSGGNPFGDLTVTPGVVDINSCKIGTYTYSDLSCLDEGIENCAQALQDVLTTTKEATCNASQATISADYITINATISNSAVLNFNCPLAEFMTAEDQKCKDGSESMKAYTMTINFGSEPAVITYTLKGDDTRDLTLGEKVYSVSLPSGIMTVKIKGEAIFTALANSGSDVPSFTDCKENDFSFTTSTELKEISIKEGESTLAANVKIDDVLFDVESVACNPTLKNPAATFTMNKTVMVTVGDETYNCGGTIAGESYDKFFCALSE